MLVGRFEDGILGTTSSTSYLLPLAPSGLSFPERAVYDSIVLASKYVYYYGDTTQRYHIGAYELTQDITTASPYNHQGASYAKTALGERSFLPRPRGNDSLRIKLDDELGMMLFREGSAKNIRTQDALIKLFKGIALVASDSYQSGFLGFAKDRTFISVYYHVDGPDGKARMAETIPVAQFFNQITNDRSETPFASLTSSRERLSTDLTEGVSVVQSGVGLMTRLDFPYLHQFGAELGKVIVNKAFLRIQLARNPENKGMVPPASIGLYPSGSLNDWELSSTPLLTGSFVKDSIHNERYYQIDVSSLVTQLVQEKTKSNYGFLIGPMSGNNSTYTTSLDRLILPKGSVKLQVYYTTLTD
jgi:hypothetical protein